MAEGASSNAPTSTTQQKWVRLSRRHHVQPDEKIANESDQEPKSQKSLVATTRTVAAAAEDTTAQTPANGCDCRSRDSMIAEQRINERRLHVRELLRDALSSEMSFNILVAFQIELSIRWSRPRDGSLPVGTYKVCGPPALLKKLPKGRKLRGFVSPRHPITLPMASRKAVGVPAEAVSYAFAHGASGASSVRATGPMKPVLMFASLGGFLYFGEGGRLIQVNALSLMPSPLSLRLHGPYALSPQALLALKAQRRIRPVRMLALKSRGFHAFGWSAPLEQPGGRNLGDQACPHGAFVYEMSGRDPVFYCVARTGDDEANVDGVGAFGADGRGSPPREACSIRGGSSASPDMQGRRGSLAVGGSVAVGRSFAVGSTLLAEYEAYQQQMEFIRSHFGRPSRSTVYEGWLRQLLPAAASLSVAGLTISLAYFSAPAFEVVATLCWYTTWCYMTWLPVSAASSSLSFKRRQKLRLLLIGVAVGATATFLALRYSCPPELALWLPSLASDALALLMVGLVLPLLLVHMRRFEAAILERSLRSVVAQRASVIPSWMPARGKDVIKTSDGAVAADVAWLPPQSTLPEADASRAAFVSKRTSSMDDLFRTSYSDASNDSLFRSSSYSSSLSTEGLVQEGTDPWEEGNEDDEAQKESGIAAADTASQQKVGEKESARTACSSWYADTLRSQMARKAAGANASSLHPPLASTVVDVSARSEITPAPPSQPLRGEPQSEYAPMRISPPAPAALSSGSTPPASSSSPVSSSGPTEHQVSHRAPPQGRRDPQEYQSQQQPRRQVPLFNPWASPAAASAPCQATASQARASLQRVAELQVTPPATLDKTHSFVAHLSSFAAALGGFLHVHGHGHCGHAVHAAAPSTSAVSPARFSMWMRPAAHGSERGPPTPTRPFLHGFIRWPWGSNAGHGAGWFGGRAEHSTEKDAAAVKIQSVATLALLVIGTHRWLHRTQLRSNLRLRHARLRSFSRPIFVASIFSVIGNLAADAIVEDTAVLFRAWLWLVLLCPCLLAVIVDLCRREPPRYSVSHAIFFIVVLYPVCHRAVAFDQFVWTRLEPTFAHFGVEESIGIAVLVVHIGLFNAILAFAKLNLTLISAPNTCAQYLFPFQLFDFLFAYAFFGLRTAADRVTPVWVSVQLLIQINVVLRNSGTMEALINKGLRWLSRRHRCLACLAHADLSEYQSCSDPIFRLQFLARLGIQSDLADLAALLTTPCLVSAFAWRDGAFELDGTGIIVRQCDLSNVWLRFALLLVIRPAASTFARFWLDRDMGRTMMCKRTLHGSSPLGLEIHNGATRLNITSRAAFEDLVNNKMRDVRCRLNLTAAEFAVVRNELSLHNLEYRQCAVAMLRKHMAFCKPSHASNSS